MEKTAESQILLAVPKPLVKAVKDALQAHGKLDKQEKIKSITDTSYRSHDQGSTEAHAGIYLIPTTTTTTTNVNIESTAAKAEAVKESLLELISLPQHAELITLIFRPVQTPTIISIKPKTPSLLASALKTWLLSIPPPLLSPAEVCALLSFSLWPYTVYPPLLLLPPYPFNSPLWLDLTTTTLKPHLPALYTLLCTTFKITHIALNAPIPALSSSTFLSPSLHSPPTTSDRGRETPNILRSPHFLQPLHNNFGPAHPPSHTPTATDFHAEFWCTARQNGIFQTWAPRYTMFSRGNISEKARLLELKTLTAAGLCGKLPGEISVVDLYAGVGYFAFCYAKKGVGKVLCWDINPWSVEGLRRGAEANRWGVKVIQEKVTEESGEVGNYADCKVDDREQEKLVVYCESNQHATRRIAALRGSIPPVRHVNCGFLPTSQDSWEIAVQILDHAEGGWIHVHENIESRAFETRTNEIVQIFTALADKKHGLEELCSVECGHFNQVKNYSPCVVHCVLDISISPLATTMNASTAA